MEKTTRNIMIGVIAIIVVGVTAIFLYEKYGKGGHKGEVTAESKKKSVGFTRTK
jgi:hypothetical protein